IRFLGTLADITRIPPRGRWAGNGCPGQALSPALSFCLFYSVMVLAQEVSIASQRRERRIIARSTMATGKLERDNAGFLHGVDHCRECRGDLVRQRRGARAPEVGDET